MALSFFIPLYPRIGALTDKSFLTINAPCCIQNSENITTIAKNAIAVIFSIDVSPDMIHNGLIAQIHITQTTFGATGRVDSQTQTVFYFVECS